MKSERTSCQECVINTDQMLLLRYVHNSRLSKAVNKLSLYTMSFIGSECYIASN